MKLALLAACVALFVAACGSNEMSVPEQGPNVVSCGRFDNRNQPPDDRQRAANRCLLEAFAAGEAAALDFSRTTVEGDPIEYEIDVLGAQRVEVVVDNREDAFGDRTVRRYLCTDLRESHEFLVWDDCEEREP